MDTDIKKISSSEIEISAEIPAVDFEKAYARVCERYNKEMNIPGFRPGHIPEHIVREKIGDAVLLQEAAEETIEEWYKKFIKENKIEAIGHPQASITKMARNNPLGIKLITAIIPAITLPDYISIAKGVMKTPDGIVVEEKEVDETIDHLQKSRMKRQPPNAEGNSESEKEIALDDEFAKGFGLKTLAELRETIRTNLKLEKEMKKKDEKRMMILEKIAEKITVEIPDVMVKGEKEKMMGELRSSIENMGMKWEDYVSHVKKTEDEIKQGWDEQAKKRALFGLILRVLSAEKHIVIEEKELEVFMENLKKQYGYEGNDPHAMEHLRDYALGVLKNEKVFQFLEEQSAPEA